MTLTAPDLRLKELVASGDYILFVGAGVAAEAGVSLWPGALRELADQIEKAHPDYAVLIRNEVANNRLLEAAELFYLAPLLDQDRDQALQSVFHKVGVTARLKQLVSGGRLGIVTTNYDRSIGLAAQQSNVDLVQFGRGVDELAAARLSPDRFLVRLHGRIEVPSTLVLAQRHYTALAHDEAYETFFNWVFTHTNAIFFGFSFADPHLRALIETASRKHSSRFSREAFALLGGQPSQELATVLAKAGVHVITYSSAQKHEAGWALITGGGSATAPTARDLAEDTVRRGLASVLAHLKFDQERITRTEVLALLSVAPLERLFRGSDSHTLEDLVHHLSRDLGLPPSEDRLVRDAIGALVQQQRLTAEAGLFRLAAESSGGATTRLDALVDSVFARAQTRYGTRISDRQKSAAAIMEVISRVLVADGVTVAHQLLRRAAQDLVRVDVAVRRATLSLSERDRKLVEPYQSAIANLLTRPEPQEEALLDKLNAVCFAAGILIVDPSTVAQAEAMLQRALYLDTNIVLPWMCEGHVSSRFYGDIVSGLTRFRPKLLAGYLNEIVSHRRLAIEQHGDGGLSDLATFESYCRFAGTEGLNAFLSGWAGVLSRDRTLTFASYLERYAPFTTEDEAGQFLERRGVEVVDVKDLRTDSGAYGHYRAQLDDFFRERAREQILVQHDATMLATLYASTSAPFSPVFVTADRGLLRAAATVSAPYNTILPMLLLPHQAAYLAELSGQAKSFRGLSRALWTMRTDRATHLREFYTDRILAEYEHSLLKDIPVIVDDIVDLVEKSGRVVGGHDDPSNGHPAFENFRVLGAFEPQFHQMMAKAQEEAERRGAGE